MPDSDVSINAIFEANTYNVTLNADGGTIAEEKNITNYTYGVGATLPTKDDMTREGYTFDGWYDNNGFSGSSVTTISPTDTGAKTFYAKWTKNSSGGSYTPPTYKPTINQSDEGGHGERGQDQFPRRAIS